MSVAMKNKTCIACGKKDLEKDIIGINMKLLGNDIGNFYCIDCLSDYLSCTPQDILDKIEEFKEEGCKLFS
jgi:biotin operon repressor